MSAYNQHPSAHFALHFNGLSGVSFNSPPSVLTLLHLHMSSPAILLLRLRNACLPIFRRGVVCLGLVVGVLGMPGSGFARSFSPEPPDLGWRQVEDGQRADIRRSVGRARDEMPPGSVRERRRMSDAERQSLRQAVRDAYGDPRGRRRD